MITYQCTDHADDEAPASGSMRPAVGSVVTVLPKYAIVLFVDAYNVLDDDCAAVVRHK